MRHWMKPAIALMLVVAATGCVNQQERSKREIQRFMQTASGEYANEQGDTLLIVPVYCRMIAMDTLYVERTQDGNSSGRIVALESAAKTGKMLQLAYVFTQANQWRNLREQPELFSALLPKDVRPAGTCDLKLADDMNSIAYSCGGSVPQQFTRMQHGSAQ